MEMCAAVGVNLQRGMNFRLIGTESVILMSLRPGAPVIFQEVVHSIRTGEAVCDEQAV